jgi:hypothetical protein
MPLTNSQTTSPILLSLEERKALLWVKDHQPCPLSLNRCAPHVRISLFRRGLIQFDPKRKRFDPITYALTDAGLAALA